KADIGRVEVFQSARPLPRTRPKKEYVLLVRHTAHHVREVSDNSLRVVGYLLCIVVSLPYEDDIVRHTLVVEFGLLPGARHCDRRIDERVVALGGETVW